MLADQTDQPAAQPNDLAELISAQNKRFIIRLTPGARLETHRGYLDHAELIGRPWGSKVLSHLGSPFLLIQPSLADILLETKRNTQIMYPKDIGLILVTMSIGPGQHILEAGTGSGSFTTALAYMVGSQGRVTTYEARPEIQRLAQKNLERVGLNDRVTFKLRDIQDGFDERNVDAVFLDLPNPQDYLPQVKAALKPGGHFGTILPTTNQVSTMLIALKRERFSFIDACETMLRYFKTVPERLRPTDRMVAHTGYLMFARSVYTELEGGDALPSQADPGDEADDSSAD